MSNSIKVASSTMRMIRWSLIIVFLLVTVLSSFINPELAKKFAPIVTTLALFIVVCLHGTARYGFKNLLIFFVITWVVSNFFEALSIQIGFPFGFYYYDKLIGPRLFEVPIIIMFAYFGTGYASWVLAHVLLGQYEKKITRKQVITIPLIAAFIMVMWDLCMDPILSTVDSLWVWRDGGSYFGVPLQNYFGWFLVVYIIYQTYAFYISRNESVSVGSSRLSMDKLFWMEMVAVYGIQGLAQLLNPITQTGHVVIFRSMALITIFTMMFITLLSFITIKNR